MSQGIQLGHNHIHDAPPASPIYRRWFEIAALIVSVIVLVGAAAGLYDDFNLSAALGAWQTGVVMTLGFLVLLAYLHYYAALGRAQVFRADAQYLADRNAKRIAELRSRLKKSGFDAAE